MAAEHNTRISTLRNVLIAVLVTLVPCLAIAQTFDGPAELPRTVPSISYTPTNQPKIVGPGADLKAALASAVSGDLILVDPSVTTLGPVVLPNGCPAGITVMSSGVIPPSGTRVDQTAVLPKIVVGTNASVLKGGQCVAVIGFEIMRPVGPVITALVVPGVGAHDLLFDRVYVHGTPTDETVRGFNMSSVMGWAVVESYIADFHCFSPGSCGDAQGIAGGYGTVPEGNCLIRNNSISSSGENIGFGGSSATTVPEDCTIINNDLWKPMSWNPGDPSYAPANFRGVPTPWSVKNLFELKTGRRFLVEGNRMTGTWGGFTQTGFAILLTPKNQGGQCSVCTVEDVTFRKNTVSFSGQALQLVYTTTAGGDYAAGGGRWSIHDNSFTDLAYPTCYKCTSWTIQLSSVVSPTGIQLHDVSVDHNTFLPSSGVLQSGMLTIGGVPISGIQFTNNLIYSGKYAIFGTDWKSCTSGQQNKPTFISACWTDGVFTGNTIKAQGTAPAMQEIPAGNDVVTAGAR